MAEQNDGSDIIVKCAICNVQFQTTDDVVNCVSGHVFHADCFAEQVKIRLSVHEALINSDQYATKADLTRIKCSVCHDKMNTLHLRPP